MCRAIGVGTMAGLMAHSYLPCHAQHDLIETGSRNLTTLLEEWVSAESVPISPEDYGPRGE